MLTFPGKIPIRIHPLFWLLAIVIGWLATFNVVSTILWIFVILVSVLVHEFGHALTAVYFGHRAQIDLVGLGGLTRRAGPKLPWWKEFLIVLDGPLAGLLLALVAFQIRKILGAQYTGTMLTYTLEVTFLVNVFWTVLNLLPIVPLDGGRLFTILMEAVFGIKGLKVALFLSFVLAGLVGVFFFIKGQILIGAIFMMLTFESYRAWKDSLAVTPQDQNDELRLELQETEQLYHFGDKEGVVKKLEQLREKSQTGVIFMLATEKLAMLFAERGEFQQAYDLCNPVKKKLSHNAYKLYHRLAYQVGNLEEAIRVGNQIFKNEPDSAVAIRNAKCHALLEEERQSVGWLQSAFREGIPNIRAVLALPEFDHIRHGPLFQDFEKAV